MKFQNGTGGQQFPTAVNIPTMATIGIRPFVRAFCNARKAITAGWTIVTNCHRLLRALNGTTGILIPAIVDTLYADVLI